MRNTLTDKALLSRYIKATTETIRHHGWLAILLSVSHIILLNTHSYRYYPFLDIPLHFFGGLAIAMLISGWLTVFPKHQLLQKTSPFVHAVLIFSLTCTVAIFWEFSEWILDHTISSGCQLGRNDTMQDLFLGTLGGSIYTVITFIKLHFKQEHK